MGSKRSNCSNCSPSNISKTPTGRSSDWGWHSSVPSSGGPTRARGPARWGGPKAALIGAGVGFLIGTGLKIGDQIFGDHQIQEEFNLRSRQLAEKYPNAAARDAYEAARDAELAECERFLKEQ